MRSVGGAWGPVLPALPAVAVCLADATGPPAPSLGSVLERVLAHPVDRCAGLPACWPLALVVAYLACCTLIGRRVAVWPVDCEGADANVGPMVGGRVVGIGDDLSSQLDRADVPVAGGRLVFTDDGTVGDSGA